MLLLYGHSNLFFISVSLSLSLSLSDTYTHNYPLLPATMPDVYLRIFVQPGNNFSLCVIMHISKISPSIHLFHFKEDIGECLFFFSSFLTCSYSITLIFLLSLLLLPLAFPSTLLCKELQSDHNLNFKHFVLE